MILIDWDRTHRQAPGVAMVFGTGLVGSAIVHCLAAALPTARTRHLGWNWSDAGRSDAQQVEEVTQHLLAQRPEAGLSVIWAAGRSGFGTDTDAMSEEADAVRAVIETAHRIGKNVAQTKRAFHHVSSAGGLFEGQVACGRSATPHPLRPYGEGKLVQERLVADDTALGRRRIYRPSSVYGFAPGARRGLIPALIEAAFKSRPARIMGAMTTQRDYVFAPDVGRYIAQTVLNPGPAAVDTATLALGRPTAIFEVIRMIEARLGATLMLQIDPRPDNARDNTFLPASLPSGFRPTALVEGIESTARAMQHNHMTGASA